MSPDVHDFGSLDCVLVDGIREQGPEKASVHDFDSLDRILVDGIRDTPVKTGRWQLAVTAIAIFELQSD